MIREKISSSTVLLLAYTGKNLRFLYVRRNSVLLKCEWPKNPEWSWEFYKWLRKNSRWAFSWHVVGCSLQDHRLSPSYLHVSTSTYIAPIPSPRTYEDMEREVSQMLGFRWYGLNDKQFKLTSLNINTPFFYEKFEE